MSKENGPSAPASKKHAPRGRIKAFATDRMDTTNHKDAFMSCTATAKGSRQRCKRRPIPGGTVCVKHGGGAPQVQLAAEARLKALIHPAIARLAQLVDQREFPSVAIAAVKDVLDRNGALGRARETVDATVTVSVDIASILNRRKLRHVATDPEV